MGCGRNFQTSNPPYKARRSSTNQVALERLLPAYIVLVTSAFQYQYILIAADPPPFVLENPTQILASDQSLKYYKRSSLFPFVSSTHGNDANRGAAANEVDTICIAANTSYL
jgi:hypothetical protein